uniref:Uncharacterized protein n=1 Tax=Esox lucius TaxID=8010 RepID=A0A3P8XH00_ESOLU
KRGFKKTRNLCSRPTSIPANQVRYLYAQDPNSSLHPSHFCKYLIISVHVTTLHVCVVCLLSRRLVSAVRYGRGYFQLLQKEKDQEEALQWEQKRREEWQRSQPRPPCVDSDNDPWRKKAQSVRPFTPIHHSLTSSPVPETPREPIFRQLCCLNWILEALILDRTGRPGPVTSCWDPKDPGRGRTTIKTLNREKAIETKWEQFVSQPKVFYFFFHRPSRSLSGRLHSLKDSSLSVASSSALGSPMPLDSLFSSGPTGTEESVAPGATVTGASQDGAAQPGAAGDSETGPSMSECKETGSCVLHVHGRTGCQGPWDGQHSKKPNLFSYIITPFIHFPSISHSIHSSLYSSLHPLHTPRLSSLLSSLPAEVSQDRRVSRVVEKLRRFTDEQNPKVRSQLFLKVLGDLQPWELCLPDLCVAIEIARENVVQMSREDYDSWSGNTLFFYSALRAYLLRR